jgi:hypothetical protein
MHQMTFNEGGRGRRVADDAPRLGADRSHDRIDRERSTFAPAGTVAGDAACVVLGIYRLAKRSLISSELYPALPLLHAPPSPFSLTTCALVIKICRGMCETERRLKQPSRPGRHAEPRLVRAIAGNSEGPPDTSRRLGLP